MAENKRYDSYDDYFYDDEKVSPAEREKIMFEVALIGKMIEARESQGISQRQLAEMTGIKQPSIARLERMNVVPKIDTLMELLRPLGYTLDIVPIGK